MVSPSSPLTAKQLRLNAEKSIACFVHSCLKAEVTSFCMLFADAGEKKLPSAEIKNLTLNSGSYFVV